MHEDVKMGWVGRFNLPAGKASVREFFKDTPPVLQGGIGGQLEEGNQVVLTWHLTAKMPDGQLQKSFFSDHYRFEDGKVKEIQIYVIFQNLSSPQS